MRLPGNRPGSGMVRPTCAGLHGGMPSVYALGMHTTLSWSQSEVREMCRLGDAQGTLQIVLSAASVRRQASPAATQWGHVPGLVVWLRGAQVLAGDIAEGLGNIAHGQLRLAMPDQGLAPGEPGTRWGPWQALTALPWHADQALQLSLVFKLAGEVVIQASSAQCSPPADARFIESYAC